MTTHDLEERLRQAFERSAELVAHTTSDWNPTRAAVRVATAARSSRRPGGRVRVLVGVVSAAAIAGAIVLGVSHQPPSAAVPQLFQPDGVEFPISATAPLIPSGTAYMGASIDPDSIRSILIPDHPALTVSVQAWQINGHVRRYRCLEERGGGAGCGPEWTWATPDIGATSTVDNRIGTFDVWTWANVPDAAAFVTWTSGSGVTMWQRPIAGVAAFPVHDGEMSTAIAVAYDDAGRELAQVGVMTQAAPGTDPDGGLQSNLGEADTEELARLANDTMESCLAAGDGNSWNQCVEIADAQVHIRFEQLGGLLVPYETDLGCDPDYTESTQSGRITCSRTPLSPAESTATTESEPTPTT